VNGPQPLQVRLHAVPRHVARIDAILAGALGTWGARGGDDVDGPDAARAASTALAAIDAMQAELHEARLELVAEIRARQDAAIAHGQTLIAEQRQRPAAGGWRFWFGGGR
jgi:hypothetical protein